MGLNFASASSQYLYASWTPSAVQPMTLMAWVRRASDDDMSIICVGNPSVDLSFNAAQNVYSMNTTRAISFYQDLGGGEADGTLIAQGGAHLVIAMFDSTTQQVIIDGTLTSAAATYGTNDYSQIGIGRTISASITEYYNGVIEHAAIWTAILSSTERTALYNRSINPFNIQNNNLIAYLPFKGNMVDYKGSRTWSTNGFGSPAYTNLGVEYPLPVSGPMFKENSILRR